MSTARAPSSDRSFAPLAVAGAAEPVGIDSDIGVAWISADARVISANPAFHRLLATDVASGSSDAAARSLLDCARAPAPLEELLRGGEGFYLEIPCDAADDAASVHLGAGRVDGGRRLVVLQQLLPGAVHRRRTEFERDPLTGLGNRRLLDERLAALENGTGETVSTALLLIDLDRFKQVNDTLGHGVGDMLLKLVTERIRRSTRPEDSLIRLGGDEFVILQGGDGGRDAAERLSRRLVDLLGRPFLIDGHQINIGASVGVALLDPAASTSADLLRHADLALYASKKAGRGKHTFFEIRLETEAFEKRELELSLRRALGLRQFELHYQPQVRLPEGTVNGFEALIRWNLPDRGLVPPADFIPLAEETGDILAIGEWTLRTACLEAMNWPGSLTVAVNVSPVQFASPRFLDSVLDALEESGLPPERLEIEITEGVLVADPARTLELLKRIRAFGVGVAMDDFGTGYSSLSYLSAFPFSKIKIDQSFVNGEQTERSRALVQAILGLGTSLDMSTIAEGVETADQFDCLASDGCRAAQGYLISRPIPPGDIADFLGRQRP